MRFQVGEIYDALNYIIDDTSLIAETGVRSRAEAKDIALKLKSFKFLCSLVIWYELFYEINVSSKLLQTISLDISETIYQLNKTKQFFQEYRTNENFEKILKKARELANELDVEDSFPLEQVRARRKKNTF